MEEYRITIAGQSKYEIELCAVQYLSTLPSLIWKKCSVVFKKTIPAYVI